MGNDFTSSIQVTFPSKSLHSFKEYQIFLDDLSSTFSTIKTNKFVKLLIITHLFLL